MRRCRSLLVRVIDRGVVEPGLFVGRFDLENHRTQTVVAGTDRDAGLADPVTVVEEFAFFTDAVGEREDILIDRLPGFVAEAFRLGVVGMKTLTRLHHGAGTEIFYAVLFGEFGVEGRLQNSDFALFHCDGLLAAECLAAKDTEGARDWVGQKPAIRFAKLRDKIQ